MSGVVERGHGVASGRGAAAPHPEGSLARQYPIFKERGLDLGHCFGGTLNVSIRPLTYRLIQPSWRFTDVRWSPVQPPENFLLARCHIVHASRSIAGWVYQPDPATKTVHVDDPSHLQVVAPFVPSLGYGSGVTLRLRSREIELVEAL